MNPILSCTDGSVYADSVYHYTAWAAKNLTSPVEVIHMLDPHRERAEIKDLSGNFSPGMKEQLLDELVSLEESKNRVARIKGQAIIDAAVEALNRAGVKDINAHQIHGSLVEHLGSATSDASLAIIGKRGQAHGEAREHLGSNMERAIRASQCPVLVTSFETHPTEKFLLAYDGGKSSMKALEYVLTTPLLKGMTCELVRVGHATPEAEREMNSQEQGLTAAGYDVRMRIISGDPAQVFSVLVEKEKIDLLVMGAYGHSKVRQFLVGSTTTEMIRSCRVPVLMFR
ncbi:MAG: universal stress protein [Verrucomicrobiota bacterium]